MDPFREENVNHRQILEACATSADPFFRPGPSIPLRAGHDAAAGGLAGACSEKSFPLLAKPLSFGSFLSGPSGARLRATSSRRRAMRGDI